LPSPANAVISANPLMNCSPLPAQLSFTTRRSSDLTDFNPSAVIAQHLSATNTFTVTVQAIHNGPVLAAQTNRTIAELTTLLVTNARKNTHMNSSKVSYQLIVAPAERDINTNGVITW